jgi:hypothetical protein
VRPSDFLKPKAWYLSYWIDEAVFLTAREAEYEEAVKAGLVTPQMPQSRSQVSTEPQSPSSVEPSGMYSTMTGDFGIKGGLSWVTPETYKMLDEMGIK